MTFKFTKMHGLGNDFIVIDGIHQRVELSHKLIQELADRHTGIGFDQCLVVESPKDSDSDFFYRIYNADGHEAGQCGNGARCLMRFVHHYGLTSKKNIKIRTRTTSMQLQLNDNQSVTVNFGRPRLRPEDIPLIAKEQSIQYFLPMPDGTLHPVYALNVGNPHAISLVDNLKHSDVKKTGKIISEHPFFPEQVNAGFMQVTGEKTIQLRVYERGVGETSACGSGALAAGMAGRLFLNMPDKIEIELSGGILFFQWDHEDADAFLTGPAEFIFEGKSF